MSKLDSLLYVAMTEDRSGWSEARQHVQRMGHDIASVMNRRYKRQQVWTWARYRDGHDIPCLDVFKDERGTDVLVISIGAGTWHELEEKVVQVLFWEEMLEGNFTKR